MFCWLYVLAFFPFTFFLNVFCLSLFLTADVRGPFEGYPQPVRFNTYGVIIFHNRNNII